MAHGALKSIFLQLEESDVEICDEVYEAYTELLRQQEEDDDTLCYKTYTLVSCLITYWGPGRIAQLATCLTSDACLTADPGVVSSIPARPHTFVEIDHEIISMVILLPFPDSFKKSCCQLQGKVHVCALCTG